MINLCSKCKFVIDTNYPCPICNSKTCDNCKGDGCTEYVSYPFYIKTCEICGGSGKISTLKDIK